MSLAASLLVLFASHAAEIFEGQAYYAGELHVHTGVSGDGWSSDIGGGCPVLSDGTVHQCGSLEEVVQLARAAGLDFLALTEHANGDPAADPEEWLRAAELMREGHQPEEGFVTLVAAELWLGHQAELGGHLNLYLFEENDELEGLSLDDLRHDGAATDSLTSCEELWDFAAQVEATWGTILLLPHHPAMGDAMGSNWSCYGSPEAARYLPAVEVYSEHGNSEFPVSVYDPVWLYSKEDRSLHVALADEGFGLRLGFLAATDNHETAPGSTCKKGPPFAERPYGGGLTIAVLPESEELSRMALYQAIVERRTYATSGPLVPATVEYWAAGQLLGGMGEELTLPAGADLELQLRIPAHMAPHVDFAIAQGPTGHWELSSDGEGLISGSIDAEKVPEFLYPVLALSGESWYGGEECKDGGESAEERVWLSPTWFDADVEDTGLGEETGEALEEESDDEGCGQGCGAGAGSLGGPSCLLALLALLERRRRDQAAEDAG